MSKSQASQLDQHAETLVQMEAAKKTLAEMVAWLKEEGIVCSISTVGRFLEARRAEQSRERWLGRITSGAQQVREVEAEFLKNPAPELETLIKLHRVLILQLSTQGIADPEFLKLSDQLTNTVLNCLSAQTKAQFKEREVTLAEAKAAEAKKTEQERALERCLEEAKAFPAVQELFKAAFTALKTAKTK